MLDPCPLAIGIYFKEVEEAIGSVHQVDCSKAQIEVLGNRAAIRGDLLRKLNLLMLEVEGADIPKTPVNFSILPLLRMDGNEPRRVCRRPFRLSYAATAGASSMA